MNDECLPPLDLCLAAVCGRCLSQEVHVAESGTLLVGLLRHYSFLFHAHVLIVRCHKELCVVMTASYRLLLVLLLGYN